jgi:hypothetical protein
LNQIIVAKNKNKIVLLRVQVQVNITGKLLVPFAQHQEAKPWSHWMGVLDKKIV